MQHHESASVMRLAGPPRHHAGPMLRESWVLLVDDDPLTRESTGRILRRRAIHVHEADSGAAAIAALRARPFDLALIDFRLPDISGLEVIATLKKDRLSVPWVLMSGWMTPPLAVEAMRLGALDAVELPVDIEGVVLSALRGLAKPGAARWPRVCQTAVLSTSPKSAAERWAFLVLRGCSAEHDLKTIGDWAAVAGISYSALTDSCRLVGVRPHDARDFLRMLRALWAAGGRSADLEHGLHVNDFRTLKKLFGHAGLTMGREAAAISLPEFIARQQFVDPTSEAVKALLKMIDGTVAPS
jgi:ActR/RegA family two-component response regulator